MFALYYLLQGITNGGINSALMNLIFDYVPLEKRADSLFAFLFTVLTVVYVRVVFMKKK